MDIGFIGFGEAAQAFTRGWRDNALRFNIAAYDVLFDNPQHTDIRTACANLEVSTCSSAPDLAARSDVVICAVTADQVLNAARSAGAIPDDRLYLDINSAAPQKKVAAAEIVGPAYLDLAVLAPVHPNLHNTRILVGGGRADPAAGTLRHLFPKCEVFSAEIGQASLFKMIRSIFVKGVEAVTMECALAAFQAGLEADVFPSLDNTIDHASSRALADYNTERVATHGVRRAAEMDEVCDTLAHLGLPDTMSKAAASMQRLVGEMQLSPAPDTGDRDARSISHAVLRHLNARRT